MFHYTCRMKSLPKTWRKCHVMSSRCRAPSEERRQRERIICTWTQPSVLFTPRTQCAFFFAVEPYNWAEKQRQRRREQSWSKRTGRKRQPKKKKNSPLVHECELAVNGAARDELSRLDSDIVRRLVGAVGEWPTHHHQAGQVGTIWSLGVTFLLQLLSCPGVHVAGAVEGAVFPWVCRPAGKEVGRTKRERSSRCWNFFS